MQDSKARRVAGHTLHELLTVIAILAILILILMPSLSAVRAQARTVACAGRVRNILQGMNEYALVYNETVVGAPATSGSYLLDFPGPGYPTLGTDTPMIGDCTQVFDYAGPIMRMWYKNFQPKKLVADQFNDIRTRNEFRCPSNKFTAMAWRPFGNTFFSDSFNIDAGAGPMISYNTSRNFMFVGIKRFPAPSILGRPVVELAGDKWHGNSMFTGYENRSVRYGRGIGYSYHLYEDGAPEWYLPNLRYVGRPSRKVFVADGARYTYLRQKPDYDLRYYADWGGCFADGSPYLTLSRSWSRELGPGNTFGTGGVLQGSPIARIDPRRYSYRHGNGQARGPWRQFRMNVGFFDGHVELMDDVDSANPHLWLPQGGRCKVNPLNSKIAQDVQRRYGSIPAGGIR